jgi:hypothetical protein
MDAEYLRRGMDFSREKQGKANDNGLAGGVKFSLLAEGFGEGGEVVAICDHLTIFGSGKARDVD